MYWHDLFYLRAWPALTAVSRKVEVVFSTTPSSVGVFVFTLKRFLLLYQDPHLLSLYCLRQLCVKKWTKCAFFGRVLGFASLGSPDYTLYLGPFNHSNLAQSSDVSN